MAKAGVVAIIGRVNVGKSTLLNFLVGEKVAIVSPVPQTTRNQIRAILNEERGQIVFLDTPGMHVASHALDRSMIASINASLSGADIVLHLADVTERVGEEERMVADRLKNCGAFIILGLNKIDRGVKYLDEYIRLWEAAFSAPIAQLGDRLMLVPFSGLTGENVGKLLDELFGHLPQSPPFYPEDVLTDFPRQLTIQDIIREKFLLHLRQELPFSLAVFAEEIIDRSPKLCVVRAMILVERPSQKAIVIGKGGELLKKVGRESRLELAKVYGKKFYLELWVKVEENWKENRELLRQMGYIL